MCFLWRVKGCCGRLSAPQPKAQPWIFRASAYTGVTGTTGLDMKWENQNSIFALYMYALCEAEYLLGHTSQGDQTTQPGSRAVLLFVPSRVSAAIKLG